MSPNESLNESLSGIMDQLRRDAMKTWTSRDAMKMWASREVLYHGPMGVITKKRKGTANETPIHANEVNQGLFADRGIYIVMLMDVPVRAFAAQSSADRFIELLRDRSPDIECSVRHVDLDLRFQHEIEDLADFTIKDE